MQQYAIRRLLLLALILVGVSVLIFLLMRVVPGDVTSLILGEAGVSEEARADLRQKLGLDRPLPEQYLTWVGNALRLDLGTSLWTGKRVLDEIGARFRLTLTLAIFTVIITTAVALPLGVVCAIRQDTGMDYFLRIFSIAGLSFPAFWLGILIILFLVRLFHWMPALGYIDPFRDPWASFQQLIWPAMAVGYRQVAISSRMTRSCLLEVLRQDYIRTAWAKGLRERVVIYRHALKNALMPVVTLIGMEFAFLFGGLVVTETVFNIPGVASFLVEAIFHRDYPVVQAVVLLMAFIVVLANLVVDLLYGWLDPRVRYA